MNDVRERKTWQHFKLFFISKQGFSKISQLTRNLKIGWMKSGFGFLKKGC